jgi:hypothetical protein
MKGRLLKRNESYKHLKPHALGMEQQIVRQIMTGRTTQKHRETPSSVLYSAPVMFTQKQLWQTAPYPLHLQTTYYVPEELSGMV